MNWGKYFTEDEFKCSHTGNCKMNQDFVDKLNLLREVFGKPLIITSGYRDPTHPIEAAKKFGPGAHTTGKAVDISISRESAYKLLRLSLDFGFTGIGINQKGSARFLHIDQLENKPNQPRPTIWSY